nr:hypothetical protein [Victivallales bacterium]
MRVLVTGIIAGLDDKKYLNSAMKYAKDGKSELQYFNLIDEIERTGNKKLDMLLGTTNYLFEVIREREYRKIGYELEKKKCENAIIRVPATVQWNRINFKLKDHEEIKNYIRPDVIVTLIDAEWLIRERFEKDPGQNIFLRRMKEQK